MENLEPKSVFAQFTEAEIYQFIQSSIQSTLVLGNPNSIKYTLQKIGNDLRSETKRREMAAAEQQLLKPKKN